MPISWARTSQYMLPHPTSWKSILILSSSLPRSYKWSLSLKSPYPNHVYTSPVSIRATCLAHIIKKITSRKKWVAVWLILWRHKFCGIQWVLKPMRDVSSQPCRHISQGCANFPNTYRHLKIFEVRNATGSKFHTEDQQLSGATARPTRCLALVRAFYIVLSSFLSASFLLKVERQSSP